MRLSEAIRLGAMLRPQSFGSFMTTNGRSCALGAALEAMGIKPKPYNALEAIERYKASPFFTLHLATFKGMKCPCPVCGEWNDEDNVSTTIIHLNNDHRWTRERIADWVETIEPLAPLPAPPAGVRVVEEVEA